MAGAVFPSMWERGCGTNNDTASDAAKAAAPGESAIGAAKAAMVIFNRTIAIEEKCHWPYSTPELQPIAVGTEH